MITNLKLNLTMAYVGGSNADLLSAVNDVNSQNKSSLFYRWTPDLVTASLQGVRVAFPDFDEAMLKSHDTSNVSRSSVACDLRMDVLQTLYHKDLKVPPLSLHSRAYHPCPNCSALTLHPS
jgi:ABC-type proline/glycine betaine transport system substrate-binding protein